MAAQLEPPPIPLPTRGRSRTISFSMTGVKSGMMPQQLSDGLSPQIQLGSGQGKEKEDGGLLPTPVSTIPRSLRSSKTIDAFWILLNGIATVVVVFLNKITFTDPELRKCQISFAIWHFFATFLVLYAASLRPFRLFEPIRMPLRQVLPVCVLFASFLVLNNLSLTHNNVGFYQLAKIMTVPSVVLFNYLLFRRKVSRNKLLCVLVACMGVALANGVSAQSNPFGAVIASLSFCATALYQIWIGKSLQDFNISAPQLLSNQTLISCLLMIIFVPIFDTLPVFNGLSRTAVISFVMSGFVAASVNLSQFYVIGRTSALTFNVASTVKTIAVLAIGWYVEDKVMTLAEFVGIGLALVGTFMYAQTAK